MFLRKSCLGLQIKTGRIYLLYLKQENIPPTGKDETSVFPNLGLLAGASISVGFGVDGRFSLIPGSLAQAKKAAVQFGFCKTKEVHSRFCHCYYAAVR